LADPTASAATFDLDNLRVGQLAKRVELASSLRGLVRHVVVVRAEEQMRGIDARRVVAGMEDLKTFWDRADEGSVNNVRRVGAPE
jgi:hypothetical protein